MKIQLNWTGILPLALSVCLITTFVSCGNNDDDNSNDTQAEEQTQDGVFKATLLPANPAVSTALGTAEFSISGDELKANVKVSAARSGTHAQHIHAGTRCPTPSDDTNGDGVIDSTEATAVYGGVILALDSDLAGTAGTFPAGVGYTYDETASVTQILVNMGLSSLALEGKVINVHGVPESTTLPSTVQGGKAAFPITCGVFRRTGDSTSSSVSSAATSAASDAATAAASDAASSAVSSAATSAAAASSAISSATSAAASASTGN